MDPNEQQVHELVGEISNLAGQINQYNLPNVFDEMDQQMDEIENHHNEIAAIHTQIEVTIDEAKNTIDHKIAEKNQMIEKLISASTDLIKEVERRDAIITDLKAQINQLVEENEKLKK